MIVSVKAKPDSTILRKKSVPAVLVKSDTNNPDSIIDLKAKSFRDIPKSTIPTLSSLVDLNKVWTGLVTESVNEIAEDDMLRNADKNLVRVDVKETDSEVERGYIFIRFMLSDGFNAPSVIVAVYICGIIAGVLCANSGDTDPTYGISLQPFSNTCDTKTRT